MAKTDEEVFIWTIVGYMVFLVIFVAFGIAGVAHEEQHIESNIGVTNADKYFEYISQNRTNNVNNTINIVLDDGSIETLPIKDIAVVCDEELSGNISYDKLETKNIFGGTLSTEFDNIILYLSEDTNCFPKNAVVTV